MSNFLKENWFRAIVILAVILCGLSVCYYFVIVKPKIENAQIENDKAKIELQKQQLEQSKLEEQHREQEAQREAQDKLISQYRAECVKTEEENQKKEEEMLNTNNCAYNPKCAQSVFNIFNSGGKSLVGNQFIENCVNAKINGTYK